MSARNEKKMRDLLGAICEHCSNDGYCILKEITIANGTSERMLVQMKCVEIFKLVESRAQNRDIGWKTAWNLWVERGYAARFAQVFDNNEDMSYKQIYEKTVENS